MSEASGDSDMSLNETVTIMGDVHSESIESALNNGSGDNVVKLMEENISLANSSLNWLITYIIAMILCLWLLYRYALKNEKRRSRHHGGNDQIYSNLL